MPWPAPAGVPAGRHAGHGRPGRPCHLACHLGRLTSSTPLHVPAATAGGAVLHPAAAGEQTQVAGELLVKRLVHRAACVRSGCGGTANRWQLLRCAPLCRLHLLWRGCKLRGSQLRRQRWLRLLQLLRHCRRLPSMLWLLRQGLLLLLSRLRLSRLLVPEKGLPSRQRLPRLPLLVLRELLHRWLWRLGGSREGTHRRIRALPAVRRCCCRCPCWATRATRRQERTVCSAPFLDQSPEVCVATQAGHWLQRRRSSLLPLSLLLWHLLLLLWLLLAMLLAQLLPPRIVQLRKVSGAEPMLALRLRPASGSGWVGGGAEGRQPPCCTARRRSTASIILLVLLGVHCVTCEGAKGSEASALKGRVCRRPRAGRVTTAIPT